MASSDQRNGEPPSVASMRVKLKYADEQTFIEKFGTHVTRNGIFIATRSVKPTGTVVRFELQLADGRKLLKGEGVVAWKRDPDPENPSRAPGIGVRYSKLDADSRRLIERIVQYKAEHGDSDGGGVPQAPLTYGESGPVTMSATGDSGPMLTPMPEQVAVPARGSQPLPTQFGDDVAAAGSSPALPAFWEGDDASALRAMIDENDHSLDQVLERARQIAHAARNGESGGSSDDQVLRALDELARPGPIEAALASIETASQALATMLGAAAPARPHRRGEWSVKTADVQVAPALPARRTEATPTPTPTPLPAPRRALTPTPTPTPIPVARAGSAPPVRPATNPPPFGTTSPSSSSLPALSARTVRRTQPPPPPPGRRTPTAPPPVEPEPPPGDEITKQVDLSAIAEIDAAIAESEADEGGETDAFAASEATRLSPPSMLRDILAHDEPTGLELDALPAPPLARRVTAPQPQPQSSDVTDTAVLAAASLGGFALEPSELDALAPGGRRTRSHRDSGTTPLPPPPHTPPPVLADAGDEDDEDALPLDDGALLEIDPDEEENAAAGPSVTTQRTGDRTPYDDLNEALDAALDVRLDSESDVSPAALAAAAAGAGDHRDHRDDRDDDGTGIDVDLEPSTASAAATPRPPASTTSPPPDAALGPDASDAGDEGAPRKKGFFSKIFKK